MQSISLVQARKLALLSQGIGKASSKANTYALSEQVFEQLGYIQIDTISVVQRAHHHTLWSRNSSYQPKHLDKLLLEKKVFEYWSHAASYLPMQDYRFSLPRKAAIKSGAQKHWYAKDITLMQQVYSRIETEGPLMAKDFDSPRFSNKGWSTNASKRALENLFIQGDLMIPKRRNFHKVYDLSERVLPSAIDTSMPTESEYGRFLVLRFLQSHGFANISQMTYQLKALGPLVKTALNELIDSLLVEPLDIEGEHYFASTQALSLLNQRLQRRHAKILSPFDNLLIQRKRCSSIFNFDYLLECYVPAAKRQHGYFCLPILWDANLVARADCKVDKKNRRLNVLQLSVESKVKKTDEFMQALDTELLAFASFNNCDSYQILSSKTC